MIVLQISKGQCPTWCGTGTRSFANAVRVVFSLCHQTSYSSMLPLWYQTGYGGTIMTQHCCCCSTCSARHAASCKTFQSTSCDDWRLLTLPCSNPCLIGSVHPFWFGFQRLDKPFLFDLAPHRWSLFSSSTEAGALRRLTASPQGSGQNCPTQSSSTHSNGFCNRHVCKQYV